MPVPVVSKGVKFKTEVSCVAWVDLLGYGSLLERSGFDPTSELSKKAVDRIQKFQSIVRKHAAKSLGVFGMNDAAIAYHDLSARSRSVTFDVIRRAVNLYQAVTDADITAGFPGARMVIASGFRIRLDVDASDLYNVELRDVLMKKVAARRISWRQAFEQAIRNNPFYQGVLQLEANFAFTKAYLADDDGTKANLEGPACYVDTAFFTDPIPSWIKFKRYVDWSSRRMAATFGELESIDKDKANKTDHKGALDAFGVSERLSRFPGIVSRLKKSRVTR